MGFYRSAVFALLLAALLAACTTPRATSSPTDPLASIATAAPAPLVFGQAFVLRVGQSATIQAVTIVLTGVTADSRCPAQVACAWEGAATVQIDVQISGQNQGARELILYGHNRETDESRAAVSGYTVRVVRLDPYPDQPDPIPADAYTAQFIVEQTAAQYTSVTGGTFDGVIVPEHDAGAIDPRADGYWTPTKPDVQTLEAGLIAFLQSAAPQRSSDLWQKQISYKRQYAGLIRDGHRLIYASFFCDTDGDEWRQQVLFVLDGGDCFFQLTYDVERGIYDDLVVNGES